MQRRLLPRRPSQITDGNIKFVFTGTGTALDDVTLLKKDESLISPNKNL